MILNNALTKNRQKFRSTAHSSFWLLLFCFSQSAHASFTDSITIGNPKALALGHAVTADPPDIDSIHFNPAGLTQLKGRQVFIKGIAGTFTTEMKLGGYGDYTNNLIEKYRAQYDAPANPDGSGGFVTGVDANGNNIYGWGRMPYDQYVHDEALNTTSNAEGGPTIMLPGGMVDLPIAAGAAGGFTYNPPGSKFTFGTNVYSPMMNGFHRASDDPGRFAQERAAFTLITYFSPTIAYEYSDDLSIGLSVNFNYSGMGLDLPIREPHEAIYFAGSPFIVKNMCNEDGTAKDSNPLTGTKIDLCTQVPIYTQYATLHFEVDQPIVLGYNVGVLWHAQPWLSFGISYNSAIDVKMEGKYDWPILDPFKTFLVNFESSPGWDQIVNSIGALGVKLPTAEQIANQGSGKLKVAYELPQRWNIGMSVKLTPAWKYNFDVRWTQWSAFSNINLDFGNDIPLLMWGALADQVGTGGANGISPNSVKYQLGLQDVTYWGMGTEYQWSDRLVLRAGFEKRPSAVPKDQPNAFIPINDGNLLSTGFGYDLEDQQHIDFAFGYYKSVTHFPPCSANLGNSCGMNNVVYPVYAGQDIRTKVEFMLFELAFRKHF